MEDEKIMEDEKARVESFENWPPGSPVKAEDLAKNGFYFTGTGDKVKCFKCKTVLEEWTMGDDPAEEHAKFSSDCPFAANSGTKSEETLADALPFDYGDAPTPVLVCIRCNKEKVSMALYPCTHCVVCQPCSENLKNCPKCNKDVVAKEPFGVA